MNLIRKIIFVSLAVLIVVSGLAVFIPQSASAAGPCADPVQTYLGRHMCETYFYGADVATATNTISGWSWPKGYNPPYACNGAACGAASSTPGKTRGQVNADDFEEFIRANLVICGNPYSANGTTAPCPGSGVPQCNGTLTPGLSIKDCGLMVATGNAMIVAAMLGINGSRFNDGSICSSGTNPVRCGINYAINQLANWRNLVDQYANANQVNWKQQISSSALPSNCNAGAGRSDTLAVKSPLFIDTNVYCNESVSSDFYMTFLNPDGTILRINLRCGNLTGPSHPLVAADRPPQILISPNCVNGFIAIRVRDPDGGHPISAIYRIDGGAWSPPLPNQNVGPNVYTAAAAPGWRVYLAPAGFDPNTNHTIEVATWGWSPYESPPPASSGVSATAPYEPCSGGFNVDPTLNINMDEEKAQNATFNTTADITIGTSASSLKDMGVKIEYYVKNSSDVKIYDLSAPYTVTKDLNEGVNIDLDGSTADINKNIPTAYRKAGNQICSKLSIDPGFSGTVDTDGVVKTVTDAEPKENCVTIVDKPYSKFLGNDLYVGGSFGSGLGCASAPANVNTFSREEGGNIIGSSAQFAAYVMGQINGVATASMGGPTTPMGLGLSFANDSTPPPDPPLYGGNFGGSNCVHNYWNDRTGATDHGTNPTASVTSLGSGKHYYNPGGAGNGILRLNGGTINTHEHVFIYVEGSVYLPSNIVYQVTGWGSTADIPLLSIVASGNIYVDGDVSNLDGVYVAQKNGGGTGGTFYTCALDSGAYPNPEASNVNAKPFFPPDGDCNQKTLTVTGAVLANQIKLLRTKNSLRDSVPDENQADNKASEYFVFSPELYMTNVCDVPSFCTQSKGDDSITSLPPIL